MWCCCSDNSTIPQESLKEKIERYSMTEIDYNTLRNSGISNLTMEKCFQEYNQVNKILLDGIIDTPYKKWPNVRQDSICYKK